MKRVFSILLTLVMLATLIPLGAIGVSADNTEGDYEYIVENNQATITGYIGDGGDVVIPSELGGYPIVAIGEYAFQGHDTITSVVIPQGITIIERYAFTRCYDIISISIPDSIVKIQEGALYQCWALSSLSIPSSTIAIENSALDYCYSLSTITVDENNPAYCSVDGILFDKNKTRLIKYPAKKTDDTYVVPSSVTTIVEGSFEYCDNLISVVVSDSVTTIEGHAFDSCENLASITIGNGVTSIRQYTFSDCYNLSTIHIGSSVTEIPAGVFQDTSKLISITVDANNPSFCAIDDVLFTKDKTRLIRFPSAKPGEYSIPHGVTIIDFGAFNNCYNLTAVTIPDSVTTIEDDAFYSCDGLMSVTIPSSVTTIGTQAFYSCDNLSVVNIGAGVTTIGDSAFLYCPNLSAIHVAAENANYSSDGGVLFNRDKTLLMQYPAQKSGISYDIPDGVTTIDDLAFEDCGNLEEITIPDSVTSIGNLAFHETAYSKNFANWENGVLYIGKHLIEARSSQGLPSTYAIKEGTLTIAEAAFYYCNNLVSVTIPNSVVAVGERAFSYCYELSSVTFGSGLVTIGANAFDDCSKINSISLPDNVTYIGEGAFDDTAYYNNPANRENGVLYIGKHLMVADSMITGDYIVKEGTLTIADRAFQGCDNLTSVDIPDSVTFIGEWAFHNCDNLTSVNLPNGLTEISGYLFWECPNLSSVNIPDTVTIIHEVAFANCYSLTTVTIPDGVTVIERSAFDGCGRLISLDIPDSVTYIGDYAFAWCNGLTSLTLGSGVATMSDSAFYDCESLAAITVDEDNLHYCSEDGVLFNKDKTVLILFPAQKAGDYIVPDSVVIIADSAFENCAELTSVIMGDNVTNIGYYAFADCEELVSVVIGNGVTTIRERTFYYCEELTSVNIPNSVISIEEMAFYYCYNLSSIIIPDSVTFIGDDAFSWCSDLSAITVADENPCYSSVDGVLFNKDKTVLMKYPGGKYGDYTIPNTVTTLANGAFQGCDGLTAVNIPESIAAISTGAFYNCERLTTIVIPNSVTCIGDYAFIFCHGLASVILGNSVETIGEEAFGSCGIISIEFPASVISIEERLFFDCENLTRVLFTSNVGFIGEEAFACCNELTDVYFAGTEEQANAVQIDSDNEPLLNAAWHYNCCPGTHTYSGNCDSTCITCEWERAGVVPHTYGGICEDTCKECGEVRIIPYLTVGEESIAHIRAGGDVIDFVFVPEETGAYTFYATSDRDTYGYLLDAEGNELDRDDDGGEGSNFSITYTLEAGTPYALRAKYYSSSNTGSFQVAVMRHNHSYTNECDSWCNDCDEYREAPHNYSDVCDAECNDCGHVRSNYHTGVVDSVVAPTCEDYGYTVYVCTVCGETYENDWVSPTGHSGVVTGVPVPPTCDDYGYTMYKCSVCGEEYNDDWVSSLGHAEGQIVTIVLPTCTDNGYTIYQCTRCNETYYGDHVWYLGHDTGDAVEIVPPTCTEEGYTVYYCARCNTTIKRNWQSPTGHTPGEVIRTIEPTCVEPGRTENQCVTCQTTYTDTSGTPIGHNFTEGICVNCYRLQEDCIESPHNYESNCNQTWTIYKPDADYITVSFSSLTLVEAGYDFIYIYDMDDNMVGRYTGTELASKTISVDGNAVKICLVSDDIYNKYGFAVTDVGVYQRFSHEEITVSAPQVALSANAQLKVEDVDIGSVGSMLPESVSADNALVYDIYFEEDGQRIQPNGNVEVSILLPDTLDGSKCRVLHIADNGTVTDMNAVFEDGYMVFVTNHFSYYVLAEEAVSIIPGDLNGDTDINNRDLALLQQYLNGWDIAIEEAACDVTGDGDINNRDLALLQQYLNGWDVELK